MGSKISWRREERQAAGRKACLRKGYLCCLALMLVLALSCVGAFRFPAQAAKKVSLNKKKATLQVGQSVQLKLKGAKKKVKWSSSKKSVAAVSSRGKVTARQTGSAKIFARAEGRRYCCRVVVKQQENDTSQYTFRSPYLLQEHFEKHGREMGYANAAAYVAGANRVIHSPDALHKYEAEDGDDVYFMEATGEIVFVSGDGYIRTYFIADINYYNRQ